MKLKQFVKIFGILMVLTIVATAANAQSGISLPVKPKPNVMSWRSGIVEEALFFNQSEDFKPGAKQPAGHNLLVNQDFTSRPQNETAIVVNPNNPRHLVAGYNDYSLGYPIGGGTAASFDGGQTWKSGSVVFPALTAAGDFPGFVEPPVGTGDPTVAVANDGTVYHTSIGFSASFCENGIFTYQSQNGGVSFWRPIVATGRGVVDYWPYAFDCSVFLDKEYMTVDNSGGAHDGRIYVTYTRFFFEGGADYLDSPIYLAYSDDQGQSFTVAGEINGASADLCEFQVDTAGGTGPGATGPDTTSYDCDENQYSYPVVGSDGSVYVHFFNEQNESEWTSPGNFNNQILVVKVDPDTFAVSGPYFVTKVYDGLDNYPISPFNGRQTVCNGGWRLISAGNLAIGPNDELYITFADNRNGDTFPYPTLISATDGSCPSGKATSSDVFVTKSTDGGMTWSAPQKITQDPADHDNWFPWITVSDNGWVWALYYDRRLSGNSAHATDAWVALSRDGGASWNEFRASEVSSDFFYGFQGSPSFIGDYNGIAAVGTKAFPFWTDARVFGDTDVYMDVVQPGGK